jgi:hypothetical protein
MMWRALAANSLFRCTSLQSTGEALTKYQERQSTNFKDNTSKLILKCTSSCDDLNHMEERVWLLDVTKINLCIYSVLVF